MLAYERHGSGDPLVLIHGIGHRRQAWYPVVDQLAEHRDVILVDLPGHGDSPDLNANGLPVKEAIEADLMAFFDDLGLDRPHVAGNSLGGRVAMEIAADGRARSVTGLAPAAFWKNSTDFIYIDNLFRAVTTAAGASKPVAPYLVRTSAGRRLLLSWLTTSPENIEPDVALADLKALLAARPALRTIMDGAYPFARTIPTDVPVTIAWGTHDRVLLPYQAKRARTAMPEANHVTLPNCGHVPMSDDPRLIADVILRGSRVEAPDRELAA